MPSLYSQQFRNLHAQQQALMLINIWDAASAAIAQKSGATALATSSASLAWVNGYADGNAMPKEILLRAVGQIIRVCKVPLSVDIENGYSDSPSEVANLVATLTEMGVAGINIEDGAGSPALLSKKISSIRQRITANTLFINARTDVYLRPLVEPDHYITETIVRLKQYIAAGADGVFVPGMTDATDVAAIASSVNAPLNVMIEPDSRQVKRLVKAGVARLSVGPSSFIQAYKAMIEISNHLLDDPTEHDLNYETLNAIF